MFFLATIHKALLLLVLLWSTCHAFLVPNARAVSVSTTAMMRPATALVSPLFRPSPFLHNTAITATATTSSNADSILDYDWKNHWYALTFNSYIPNPSESAEAVPAAVFGHPLVLWRSHDNGEVHCAHDVCPHRSAALSEGRLRNGNLECLYHGWEFASDGTCVRIPQLKEGAAIPKRACLKLKPCRIVEGIVWVWMGDGKPTKGPPRQDDGLDEWTGKREGFFVNDVQIDLPYDHSYLAENLIDPAHVAISHDRTQGGGVRENAQPYEMILDEDSVSSQGFTGRFRYANKPDASWIELKFEAPGIIRQTGNPRGSIQFGAALHCMPLALGRSRLLFRAYFGGLPWLASKIISSKPKWQRNLNSCKILEQDVGLITTQEDHFSRNPNHSLQNDYLLIKSSDTFVDAYRTWMDRVGHGMPWFQGLATRSPNVGNHLAGFQLPPAMDPANHRSSGQDAVETRYHRHVMHCPTTRKALENVQMFKKLCFVMSILAVTATAGLAPFVSSETTSLFVKRLFTLVMVPAIPLFTIATALLRKLESHFFVSFKRKDQLRTEKGI